MKYIQTNNAPAAIGPYSQAVLYENILFTSGQLGIDPHTNLLLDGIVLQTRQALSNLNQVLLEAKMTINNITKITIFLKHMDDFQQVNEVYSEFFKDHKPARTTVEVSGLPKSALIEIEAIALK